MSFKSIKVIHVPSQTVLASKIIKADNFFTRLQGMMFRPPLAAGEGIIISPCQQIHTHFMGYALDVIFLDSDYRVCYLISNLKPWKFTKFIKSATHVLELPADVGSIIQLGDQIQLS